MLFHPVLFSEKKIYSEGLEMLQSRKIYVQDFTPSYTLKPYFAGYLANWFWMQEFKCEVIQFPGLVKLYLCLLASLVQGCSQHCCSNIQRFSSLIYVLERHLYQAHQNVGGTNFTSYTQDEHGHFVYIPSKPSYRSP